MANAWHAEHDALPPLANAKPDGQKNSCSIKRWHHTYGYMNRTRALRLGKAEDKRIRQAIAARDFPRLFQLKLQRLFPEASIRIRAQSLLERYGGDASEPEAERVRLAVLRLAESDIEKIAATVEGAKEDYRDIIAWAESPTEMRFAMANAKLSSTKLAEVREKDKRQYEEWLDEHERTAT